MFGCIRKFQQKHGQSLIELLITIAVSSIILPALLTGFVASRTGRAQQEQRMSALGYLKEAQEALRVVQNNGWSNLSNGTFHPAVSGSTWILSSGQENLEGSAYTRRIVIADVQRDAGGSIVASGGTVDPSTKLATVTVSWGSLATSSVSSMSYLTRHTSASHIDTKTTDFSGTASGTAVLATSGSSLPNDAQIQLGAGGYGDWCNPNLTITAFDLPKNGVANAVSAIEGRVFAGTGDNASGVSFANVNISNTKPPVASSLGTYDGYKTNDIFGEANYAYMATDNNSKEIEIIDLTHLSSGKYSEAGSFNAPGNGNGTSVFVASNIGYMTDGGNHLYTFDLSSKSGSRAQLGSIALAGLGARVVVVGSYAYVAISGAATELQIIQVSNGGRTLSVVGQADVNGQAGKSVYINPSATRAYLATGQSAAQKELFIIDISSKVGNRPILGSYESNGMDPKGVTVVPSNKLILVGSGAEEYQVVNIANEAVPVRCGGLQINTGVNGVAAITEQDGDAYSYIITGDSSTELKIIEGGPGGQFATSGTYYSPIFDAGTDVFFNKFTVNQTVPNSTTIQHEIAIAAAVNGSCASAVFAYAGPFATSSAIPVSISDSNFKNPGRCLKYRATFSTTDTTSSPELFDININYSP